jgi:hypothetical protein
MRKVVSVALGSPEKVPGNMLPNGLAMSGTNTGGWREEAKEGQKKASSDTKG